MNNNAIEIKNISKVYGSGEGAVSALKGVDLLIKKGEFVAIMGPSGSGKSTLMNILGCLDHPTSGTYLLDGSDVSNLSKNDLAVIRNQKLGFIFQSFNLLPRLSALANVMLPISYNLAEPYNDGEAEKRAVQALTSVGLGDRLSHHSNQLSGGQQQRVAIARALINNPPVILADEPTGNLDSKSSVEIMEILHELHRNGATVVMVTHEPDIAQHAQRIVCVKDGKILADGKDGRNPCLKVEEK